MKIKILYRYLFQEFCKPLAFILMVFVGLYIIAQLVDEMGSFVAHHPPLPVIIIYYLYRIPFFMVQVMPLAVLLSSLLALGQLSRQNELVAMRACGVSFYQIAAPILLTAFGVVLLVLAFDEVIIPLTNPRADFIKKTTIEHKSNEDFLYRRDRVTRSTSDNRILFMRQLDALAGKMEQVIYLETGPQMTVTRRVDAPRAHWSQGQWIFEKGVLRSFDAQGNQTDYRLFKELGISFKESPKEFIRDEKDANQLLAMTVSDLRARIRLLKETGSNAAKEEVNLQLKFAFPFANFVLVLLGIAFPFIFPSGHRALIGAAIGFVITLVIGFFYIGFIAVGTSLGNNGTLSPFVSVWMANVCFGCVGLWVMRKARS